MKTGKILTRKTLITSCSMYNMDTKPRYNKHTYAQ